MALIESAAYLYCRNNLRRYVNVTINPYPQHTPDNFFIFRDLARVILSDIIGLFYTNVWLWRAKWLRILKPIFWPNCVVSPAVVHSQSHRNHLLRPLSPKADRLISVGGATRQWRPSGRPV